MGIKEIYTKSNMHDDFTPKEGYLKTGCRDLHIDLYDYRLVEKSQLLKF